jgi:hypothetical protein
VEHKVVPIHTSGVPVIADFEIAWSALPFFCLFPLEIIVFFYVSRKLFFLLLLNPLIRKEDGQKNRTARFVGGKPSETLNNGKPHLKHHKHGRTQKKIWGGGKMC